MKPLITLIIIFSLAIIVLLFLPHPQFDSNSPSQIMLPDHILSFHGKNVLYCQNENCGRHFEINTTKTPFYTSCPYCGNSSDILSPAEKRQLPPGTKIARKIYKNEAGHTIIAAVVSSGRSRTSFHRPQICFTTQGYIVEKQKTIEIGEGTNKMKVSWLDIKTDDATYFQNAFFAYWFFNAQHATPFYLVHLIITSAENILHNKITPWAYVSVLSENNSNFDKEELKLFIQELHGWLKENLFTKP